MHARTDWTHAEVRTLYSQPFMDLLLQAQAVHRVHHVPNTVQVSTLLSIKTGGCPEDCAYCPQSVHVESGVAPEPLLDGAVVRARARAARAAGATRFCMGAAWRSPKPKDVPKVAALIAEVKALGLETCATLGMLTPDQAATFKAAGLDFYNHNLDSSAAYYERIITTRTYQDRLDTLAAVRGAGLKVCCGGIVGMGESREDRIGLLHTLASLPQHPHSVPINQLVRVRGTPLGTSADPDVFEFVRTIATARILMPAAHVRLAAGRNDIGEAAQALCFLAGANSIFHGEKLLTTGNPDVARDEALFERLGLRAEGAVEPRDEGAVA